MINIHRVSYSLDNKKLHVHIIRKLNRLNKSQRHLEHEQIISRATLHRIQNGKSIQMSTFLKLVEWLRGEPKDYISMKIIRKRIKP